MKNTIRVRHKHSTARPGQQVTPKSEPTVTLVFLSEKNGEEFARVKIPEKIFKHIKLHVRETGITFQKFWNDAIREKISRDASGKNASILNFALGGGK